MFSAGVKQGCLLLYIFNICIFNILCCAFKDVSHLGVKLQSRTGSRTPEVFVSDLDFADEIALTAQSILNAQILVNRVEEESSKIVGLHFNLSRVITINCSGDILISSGKLKNVNDFKYLGCWIRDSFCDFNVRRAMAWKASTKLQRIWDSNLKIELKIQCFRSLVESLLLYGPLIQRMLIYMVISLALMTQSEPVCLCSEVIFRSNLASSDSSCWSSISISESDISL